MLNGVEDGGTVPAEYGGWSTISRLVMTPDVEDHGEIYACRATNMLLNEAVSDAVTLNVICMLYFLLSRITIRFDNDNIPVYTIRRHR